MCFGIIVFEIHDWLIVIVVWQNDVDFVVVVGSIFVVLEYFGLWVDYEI